MVVKEYLQNCPNTMTIREYLNNCSDSEIISLWNEYRIKKGYIGGVCYPNGICYPMSMFDTINNMPFKSLYKRLDDNFTFSHTVFWRDKHGYIHSGYRKDFINAVVNLNWLAKAIREN